MTTTDSSVIGLRQRVRAGIGRYRLTVVGPDAAGVVEHAGGWMFDRAIAGWDVTVLLTRPSDPRPLRILGAAVLDAQRVLASGTLGRRPHTVAVATSVLEQDARLRDLLTPTLAGGTVETVMWGAPGQATSPYALSPTVHTLSIAAAKFKAHALRAAGMAGSPASAERFLSRSASLRGADLDAAG